MDSKKEPRKCGSFKFQCEHLLFALGSIEPNANIGVHKYGL